MRQDSATSPKQSTPERGAPRGNQCLLPRVIALVAVGAIFGPLGPSAQKSKPREFEVKATYLYNFARFVEWPTTAAAAKSDSFPICVLGQDPFGPALDTIVAGETIGGKAVLVKRVLKPQEAVSCGVLYISSSEETRLREVLAGLDKAAVLTVSDIPRFSQRGGMIQFVQESNKIRFEVNLARAEGAGLTLSSELLKVAVLVRKNSQPGD
jgi:hypothetical protein